MSLVSSQAGNLSAADSASSRNGFEIAAENLDAAVCRTQNWLIEHQHEAGYWCGELEGDSILESEYILLLAWLGEESCQAAQQAARYLVEQQLPTGGWSLYPGGPLELSASVKAYFALKLVGYDADSEPLRRAKAAIRDAGGADRVNSFTRFYLALLGQIDYAACPAVPPEIMLLPNWFPIHIYRMSAWSRTILVPLSVMWACRPHKDVPRASGIQELFLQDPKHWPPLRCPRPTDSGNWAQQWKVASWERLFRTLDGGLKLAERIGVRPFRKKALAAVEQWMLHRFQDSDGLGAIFPPIVWSVVALRCLGYDRSSPEVVECLAQLQALAIEERDTVRLQPCQSPVWDTALSLRAVASCPSVDEDATRNSVQRACNWLLSKEVRRVGDWAMSAPAASPGGWFFEHHNAFYPDIDDTIMVMMALNEASGESAERTEACQRGLQWVLALQNRDGGWGAFDRDNDDEYLCHVPFADHNAMIDPSTPDITARVLEAITQFGLTGGDAVVDRALEFLVETQESDGSWYGRWGVNHIYGTWQVLVGLSAAGIAHDRPMVRRGVEWLVKHQAPNGGWGESPASYADRSQRGRGPTTPSQTAWAMLGLMASGEGSNQAVARGAEFLVRTQRDDGGWDEPEFTGTGFPLVFYLRYHLYPIYFPLMALTQFQQEWNSDELKG